MKKTIFICILFGLMDKSLSAQQWNIRYSVRLGGNLPYYALSNINNNTSRVASKKVGFTVTGLVEASTTRYFAIQSGISFQQLGSQLDYSEFGNTPVKQHTFWLQLPVNFVGKLPLKGSSYFFLSMGPYGGFGLMGSNSFASNYTGNREDFTFGDSGSQKRFDYGVNLHFGYQLKKGYNLSAGYLLGLADLSTSSRYEQRNRAWAFTVGYSF